MDSRVGQLHSRAGYLVDEFNRGGRATGMKWYIDEAITLDREALELCPPGHHERSISLTQLSICLKARYEQFGEIVDIEDAIVLDREALALVPQGHQNRLAPSRNLAVDLSTRYKKFGMISDLNEAIVLDREAIALSHQDHPYHLITLIGLAVELHTRYSTFGATSDLDEAIVLGREALELDKLSPLECSHRSTSLDNLGVYLSTRYQKFNTVSDLDEAIILSREALTLRPQGHYLRSTSLSNLAIYLSVRYEKFGAISDLYESIILDREALVLRPQGHPDRSISSNNFAIRLAARYDKFGAVPDLDDAITLNWEALMLRPQGHPNRASSLDHLALRLYTRYDDFGEISDLDEAINLIREALMLRSKGDPNRWMSLKYLANWLATRHNALMTEHDPNTSSNDLEEIFHHYTLLADLSYAISSRDIEVSREWIRAAEKFKHPSTCLAYETSLRLLIEHLSLLPSLPQHLIILKEHTSSLAVDAFSACLRNGNSKRAVELLEQGRSVFWNQLTRLHSSLEVVLASGPAGETLANEFTRLTALIRVALHSPNKNQQDQLFHLNLEMQNVVTAIRELPGLSRFLLPPLFSNIQRAATKGPVVVVNASQYGCDALVVFDNRDPVHIPLSITRKYVQLLSSKVSSLPKRGNSRDITNALGVILRELWEDVVSPIVRFLETVHPFGSRIWWCPTAEFSDLPLHAAGPYRKGLQNLQDLYISSYTPTLTALIRARRTPVSKSGHEMKRFIAIGQANAAGQNQLLSVGSELAKIGQDVSGAATFRHLEGERSRIPLVAEELSKNEWVHFACHGLANRKEPFKSAFALRDGHFTIEQIIRCDLGDPEFAYLSACQTTVGDEESPDEAIHLASAMQFLGFRSVIGTMWSVADKDTNAITSTFYKYMLDESGRLDYTRAAFALNRTMRTVSKVTLDQQIVYIHLGA